MSVDLRASATDLLRYWHDESMHAQAGSEAFIGRQAEFGALVDAYAAGTAGVPRAVIVRGEAGVGKTRLLTEFLDYVDRQPPELPVVIARGQCVELGEIGAPYIALRRMLRELYVGVGHEAFVAAAGSPTVVATLSSFIPELADATVGTRADDAQDFAGEAVERVIETLSETHHLVLVLEDLHWADPSTLGMLRTLATVLRGEHLTLVATYRSDDVGRGHPLRAALAEFDRNRSISTIDVRRLDEAGVAKLIRAITGAEPAPEVVATLTARSDGVPFYVEELVAVGEGPLPETLRDTVLARYERLSPVEQDAARLIAVAGTHIDHAVLAEAWQGATDELLTALRTAIASGILVADESGYSFRHALISEAIYEELLPSERAELHSRLATVIQRAVDAGATEFAADAAEHWLAARDLERAFDATAVARRHARDNYAPEPAALLGERLLELWQRVSEPEARAGIAEPELRIEIVKAFSDLGNERAALRSAKVALQQVTPENPVARAELLFLAAIAEADSGLLRSISPYLEEMTSLLEGATEPRARALWHRGRSTHAAQRFPRFAEDLARSDRLRKCGRRDRPLCLCVSTAL